MLDGVTLAELQRQANFPLIAAATVLIDRQLRAAKYERVLLSSRDCYMQARLWRRMFLGTPYEVCYWLTSRIARLQPSEIYLDYCRSMMDRKTLVVDVCGTGESLRGLFERMGIQCDYLVIQSDPRKNAHRLLDGPGDLEGLNSAPHPMVIDVKCHSYPIYSNPLDVDWPQYFSHIGGHGFFECCKRTDFSEYIDASEEALHLMMRTAEKTIADHDSLFEPFHSLRRKEDWQ